MEFQLPTGQVLVIDDEDFDEVSKHTWSISNGYAISGTATPPQLHRLVMKAGLYKDSRLVVDHLNRDPLDNRKANLRICTYAENNMNKVNNSTKKKKATTGEGKDTFVRLDPETYERVKADAEADDRSVSNYISWLILTHYGKVVNGKRVTE